MAHTGMMCVLSVSHAQPSAFLTCCLLQYPSLATMPDGTILIVGGQTQEGKALKSIL